MKYYQNAILENMVNLLEMGRATCYFFKFDTRACMATFMGTNCCSRQFHSRGLMNPPETLRL